MGCHSPFPGTHVVSETRVKRNRSLVEEGTLSQTMVDLALFCFGGGGKGTRRNAQDGEESGTSKLKNQRIPPQDMKHSMFRTGQSIDRRTPSEKVRKTLLVPITAVNKMHRKYP